MSALEIILSVVTALLTGGNVLQFFQLRTIKRKGEEEANQASSESWRLIVAGNVQEIKRLQERVDYYEQKYNELLIEVINLKERLANDESAYNTIDGGNSTAVRLRHKKESGRTKERNHHKNGNGQKEEPDGQCGDLPLAGPLADT